jgi:adenylate cyclase
MGDGPAGETSKVRAELEAILRSSTFDATERNRRFLSYVVEEALAGRGDRIKAYSIGTNVFGRGDAFDPLQDPIVRIEAGRLRRSLEYHYLAAGTATGIRISIPKGSYVPSFVDDPDTTAAVHQPIHTKAPRLMVRPVEQRCWTPDCPDVGRTLTLQVISALTRFTEIFVYGYGTTAALAEGASAPRVESDYELSGALTISRTAIRAEFLLQDSREGRFLWSHSIERLIDPALDPTGLVALCSEIAGEVASIVAQRDGVIDEQAREMAGQMPARFAAYQKLVDFQDYWRTHDLKRFEPLRRDLERVIVEDPMFSAAHACLSLLYTDASRFGFHCGPVHPRPIDRAHVLARRAIEFAPRSGRAFHALGVAEWFSGEPDKAIETLKTACALNPNDGELNAELGLRTAFRMQWDVGVPLLLSSFRRNPLQSGQYRMGLVVYHLAMGNCEQALQEAMATESPYLAYPHLACAAALVRLGRQDEARAHLEGIEAMAPGLLPRLRDDLLGRQIHPELVETIMAPLEPLIPGALVREPRGVRSRSR